MLASKVFLLFILIVISLFYVRAKQNECTIKVEKIVTYKGKCVRLFGGQSACQSDGYLDPLNSECTGVSKD
uniref:Uncharacterized protein n=1 Tax=Acrobeloides nanus TaxID=290746 RepID=A0A914CZ12_9BILA